MPQKPKRLEPQLSARNRFGAELRAWREHRDLSQAKLARLVHVHPDLIAKVEKAARWPSRELAGYCDAVLCAGGILVGLWPAVEAERTRPDRPWSTLVQLGSVVGARDEALYDSWGAATVIRLNGELFSAADLAELGRYEHLEIVYGLLSAGTGAADGSTSETAIGSDSDSVPAFAPGGRHRPNRIRVSRCCLLKVVDLDLYVTGWYATGAAEESLEALDYAPILDIQPYDL